MKKMQPSLDSTPMTQKFAQLPRRDQMALLGLAVFLVLFVFGFGGWELHQKANTAQKNYNQATNDLFWLRSQSANINPNQSQSTTTADSVRQVLAQSGVNAQVSENGDTIQVNFSHSQGAVINNVFNQISQQGFTIKQLQINQATPQNLEVQSVLSR